MSIVPKPSSYSLINTTTKKAIILHIVTELILQSGLLENGRSEKVKVPPENVLFLLCQHQLGDKPPVMLRETTKGIMCKLFVPVIYQAFSYYVMLHKLRIYGYYARFCRATTFAFLLNSLFSLFGNVINRSVCILVHIRNHLFPWLKNNISAFKQMHIYIPSWQLHSSKRRLLWQGWAEQWAQQHKINIALYTYKHSNNRVYGNCRKFGRFIRTPVFVILA